ncbi:putative uncharacterized protein MGC34800 [Melospiza melodia melodia]|uniref:putative uncharacterized protein MGC34800 n=1 Tax=Melospiza melodia melodia TaxID=1914991 RepID=UPI002FD2C2BA
MARKSGAAPDEIGAGPPSPDPGAVWDAEGGAARGAMSLRGGTREPGQPPMRARPKPQDSTAGTAPTEWRGVGCPPTEAGPGGALTDAPLPAAFTGCACPAGWADPQTGEIVPPAEEPDSGVGEPTLTRLRETPQF